MTKWGSRKEVMGQMGGREDHMQCPYFVLSASWACGKQKLKYLLQTVILTLQTPFWSFPVGGDIDVWHRSKKWK